MYIHKLSDNQIESLMNCYDSSYTDIDIIRNSDNIDVEIIVDSLPEHYILHDFDVEVYDWDDSGTNCLHNYRAKMLEFFGNQYAIDYLLR